MCLERQTFQPGPLVCLEFFDPSLCLPPVPFVPSVTQRTRPLIATKCSMLIVCLQRVRQLKSLCEELDNQIQDYEEMNRQYEQQETQWKQDK